MARVEPCPRTSVECALAVPAIDRIGISLRLLGLSALETEVDEQHVCLFIRGLLKFAAVIEVGAACFGRVGGKEVVSALAECDGVGSACR